MRKIVFIFLITLVLAVVGVYTMLEFRVSEILFVTDKTETYNYGQEMVVRRLYNSGVSEAEINAFIQKTENALVSAEFDENELYAAALAAGRPEFYPSFRFSIYTPNPGENIFEFFGAITQEIAPGQENFNFKTIDINLEIMTDGPLISDIELRAENPNEKVPGVPVISADKRQLALDLHNTSGYSLILTGTGRVTFSYTYNIASNNLFTKHALEEQLLIVHANIFRNANGELSIEYINEPYSNLEEFMFT